MLKIRNSRKIEMRISIERRLLDCVSSLGSGGAARDLTAAGRFLAAHAKPSPQARSTRVGDSQGRRPSPRPSREGSVLVSGGGGGGGAAAADAQLPVVVGGGGGR